MPNLNFEPGSGLRILKISENVSLLALFSVLCIMPIFIVPPSLLIRSLGSIS